MPSYIWWVSSNAQQCPTGTAAAAMKCRVYVQRGVVRSQTMSSSRTPL